MNYSYWLMLSNADYLSYYEKYILIKKFHNPMEIFAFEKRELLNSIQINKEKINKLLNTKINLNLQKEIEDQGINLCSINDSNYPQNLKNIYSPPVLIYYRGILPKEPCIAVVGSRKTSAKGRENAFCISKSFAERGYCIVSGMARGIDSCAHHGALEKGRTAAILGCGVNICYPSENKNLMNRIIENGCVISEFPPDKQPTKYTFPARNRIISGLSESVIVVEASQKSGALITADFALDQGKDVFAFKYNQPEYSKGTDELLCEGAAEIVDIDKFVSSY